MKATPVTFCEVKASTARPQPRHKENKATCTQPTKLAARNKVAAHVDFSTAGLSSARVVVSVRESLVGSTCLSLNPKKARKWMSPTHPSSDGIRKGIFSLPLKKKKKKKIMVRVALQRHKVRPQLSQKTFAVL